MDHHKIELKQKKDLLFSLSPEDVQFFKRVYLAHGEKEAAYQLYLYAESKGLETNFLYLPSLAVTIYQTP